MLIKYHGKADIVDNLIREKEESGQFEKNPDVPSMRLYNCWDATAVVTDDKDEVETEVKKKAELPANAAAVALPGSQQFQLKPLDFEIISIFSRPRQNPGLIAAPKDFLNKETPGSELHQGEPTKGKAKGRGKGPEKGSGDGKEKVAKIPKAKTPEQEAKNVPWHIYLQIMSVNHIYMVCEQ